MASTDLIFEFPEPEGLPAHLVFGDTTTPSIPTIEVTAVGRLTGLRGYARVGIRKDVLANGRMTGLSGRVETSYVTNTTRPLTNNVGGGFQAAVSLRAGVRAAWQESQTLQSENRGVFEAALPLRTGIRSVWDEAIHHHHTYAVRFEEALRMSTGVIRAAFQQALSIDHSNAVRFEEAIRLNTSVLRASYQETLRDRRNSTAVRFQDAIPYSTGVTERGGSALPMLAEWVVRYQEAMKPPIGLWIRPDPPGPPPCYEPLVPAHLVFEDLWDGSSNLLFVCDTKETPEPGATVVVPVKEVYLTINSAILIRLDNGKRIPTTSMSMSLDVDSWTWSFSASVPGSALADVQHNGHGDPVIVQATINNTDFRFVIEKYNRSRSFNSSQLSVQGRGLAAELDAPYAPVMSFGNTEPRTARQLLDDILTVNGVPMEWSVDNFQPIDWSVPANVFSHAGSYISAMNSVVGSVGAYLQPHNTNRTLDVKMRYPVPSWQWATVAPDFELPAAVTSQEGFDWTDKPLYERVFVSGQQDGVLGQYTRFGTAGALLAPTVVDPLITHADAVRQRGRTILSDTGRIATVSLRLPVLAETGIIKPGNFVRYVEGGNSHVGISRSVSVDVSMPTIYQTLSVETHLEPV